MDLKFRRAKLNDLEEMQELCVETIKSTCQNDYDPKQIDVWVSSVQKVERWKTFLTKQYILVAENEENIVGCGSLKNGNYLDLMYVHKEFLRQGIANMIFEKLKKKSLTLGFDKLTSDVSKTAVPFFETKGFKIIKENKNMINGVEIINYHMSQ